MKKIKVLIYPCGAENALEVYAAIKHSVHVEVIAASSKKDHSELIYDSPVYWLPNVISESFVEQVNDFIREKEVDLIFPTHDTVSLYLAKYQNQLKARVITSDYNTNVICRHKLDTYKTFSNEEFVPEVYDEHNHPTRFPIFAKPNVGEGAKGVFNVPSVSTFEELLQTSPDLVFVELLPGKEFTIDCFTDRHGKLRFSGVGERVQVSMGISFHNTECVLTDEIKEIAEAINGKLNLRGLWFFQLKEDCKGRLKLLEVSTRVAGSMGFFRQKGVNLPLLSIFDALNLDVEINPNTFEIESFRSTINRYRLNIGYQNLYIDFDDTLIVNGKVNLSLLKLIYQASENGKNIYLITKHAEDIYETLKKHKISCDVFTKIYLLRPEDKKSDYINPVNSIFIDNWYLERKEVRDKHGIPVFDVDAIDSLIKGL